MKTGSLTSYALALSAGLLLLAGCTANDDRQTGITTIGNTVAGTVVDDKGTLVTNAEVRLIREDCNPSTYPSKTVAVYSMQKFPFRSCLTFPPLAVTR